MKIIFAGSPEFSVLPLKALLAGQHEVCAVYTQPDRPAGRGRKLSVGPVKQVALDHDIEVYQPKSLKSAQTQEVLLNLGADLMVVVAYGLILPKAVLEAPTHGCFNIHASILPRWRGAAPIQRAILAGDRQSGVTLMQMDVGLDTGDMLLKRYCDITPETTAERLHDQLAQIGSDALIDLLQQLSGDSLNPEQQNDADATYAKKIDKAEATIDWTQSAQQIQCLVNAFNPWPVAQTVLQDKVVRVWAVRALDEPSSDQPGMLSVVDKRHLHVSCGEGTLSIERLQLPGGKPIPVQAFLNGHSVQGKRFT